MRQARTLTPAEEMRLFAGFAIQPFLAAGVAVLGSPLLLHGRTGRTFAGPGEVAMALALHVSIGVVLITTLCVFPTVVWLVTRRPVPLTTALLFGLAFGNLPIILIVVLSGGSANLLGLHAFVSLIGLTGAAAFWALSLRGRNFSRDPDG